MDIAFGIILVIIFLLIVAGPLLSRLLGGPLSRWMAGKMEDRFRNMMGMPTRKEEKKARKRAAKREKDGAEAFRKAAAGRRQPGSSYSSMEHSGLQSYAEDVEFTEVIEYTETEIRVEKESGETFHESQISDAEYVEIKKNRAEQHG